MIYSLLNKKKYGEKRLYNKNSPYYPDVRVRLGKLENLENESD
jgi:hypothetical protein